MRSEKAATLLLATVRTVAGWAKMPPGRAWRATSAVYPAPDGKRIWVAERCAANTCAGKDNLDTLFRLDSHGKLVRSIGKMCQETVEDHEP
jgi:hypothetical protein